MKEKKGDGGGGEGREEKGSDWPRTLKQVRHHSSATFPVVDPKTSSFFSFILPISCCHTLRLFQVGTSQCVSTDLWSFLCMKTCGRGLSTLQASSLCPEMFNNLSKATQLVMSKQDSNTLFYDSKVLLP